MSTRDVVREMVEECLDTLERMNGLVQGDQQPLGLCTAKRPEGSGVSRRRPGLTSL